MSKYDLERAVWPDLPPAVDKADWHNRIEFAKLTVGEGTVSEWHGDLPILVSYAGALIHIDLELPYWEFQDGRFRMEYPSNRHDLDAAIAFGLAMEAFGMPARHAERCAD